MKMLGSKIEPPKPTKIKKLGLTGSASSEFAKRFLTKPSRQPKVIDFNAGNLHVDKKRRGVNGFFPPVKLRSSARDLSAKPNTSNDVKLNSELTTQHLSVDCSQPLSNVLYKVGNEQSNDKLHTLKISKQMQDKQQYELTHQNLNQKFPQEINIPKVEAATDTDESGSARAVESTIQFKLPPVIIGDVAENDDERKPNTRNRCTACNVQDQATEWPNIWLVQTDLNKADVYLDDFTNAILGHFPVVNVRLRRELTVCYDKSPVVKRLLEIHTLDGETDDISTGNNFTDAKQSIGKFKVELMKYMTREMYTNLKMSKSTSRAKEDRLQLVPTSYSEVRPRSNTSRTISRASRRSMMARKTPESVRTAPPYPSESYLPYPDTFDCDDLSFLPPPKRILPRRDVPWVFRYKVKRNMNELSKILASKPQQAIENI